MSPRLPHDGEEPGASRPRVRRRKVPWRTLLSLGVFLAMLVVVIAARGSCAREGAHMFEQAFPPPRPDAYVVPLFPGWTPLTPDARAALARQMGSVIAPPPSSAPATQPASTPAGRPSAHSPAARTAKKSSAKAR